MTGLRRCAGKLTALAIVAVLLGASALTRLDLTDVSDLPDRFAFEASAIGPEPATPARTLRSVHPDYTDIAGWISSVGASVALGDLDNDGLHNDLCLVDPRDDSVTLRQAAEPPAYAPFALQADALPSGPPIAPMGCLFGDADADGREDVIVYFWGRTPVLYRNTGTLTDAGFEPHAIGGDEVWNTNAALFADLDGDGHADLMFGNYFPDNSGVLDPSGAGSVAMQHSMSRAKNAGLNRLFRNTGAARQRIGFDDRTDDLAELMKNGWTLALGAADLTGDGLPEVYVANDFGPDRLLVNRSGHTGFSFTLAEGRRGLTDPRSTVLGRDSFKGMGVDFADVDGNGALDIYVSNIAEDYALHESHFLFLQEDDADWRSGNAPYRNASGRLGLARSSWSWDAKLADLDNDGAFEALQTTGFLKGTRDRWPELQELAMGNDELLRFPAVWPRFSAGDDLSGDRADAFFVLGDGDRYHDRAGLVGLGEASVSRGIALADIDADGDLDFAIARQWEPSMLYRNTSGQDSPSLVLDLRLSNSNGSTRPALGAVARLRLPDGTTRTGLVDTSNGHSGHRSPEVHFGLGELPAADLAGTPLSVEVTWRAGFEHHRRRFELAPGRHRLTLDRLDTAQRQAQAGGTR